MYIGAGRYECNCRDIAHGAKDTEKEHAPYMEDIYRRTVEYFVHHIRSLARGTGGDEGNVEQGLHVRLGGFPW